jgi:subtilisin-like proprotein convertase family protein
MQSKKRGRLALFGSLALALCLTAGLVGAADAAKKKKKTGTNAASIQKLNVPIADRAVGAPQVAVTPVDLVVPKTFGKKQVGNVDLTLQVTGSGPNYLNQLEARLIAPNGRRIGITIPSSGIPPNQSFGPTRYTANSQSWFCMDPTPPCEDPDDNVGPPFAGTVGDNDLTDFNGVKMKGTWTLKILDVTNTLTGVANLVKLDIRAAKPPAV